jgi:hypothetical protein
MFEENVEIETFLSEHFSKIGTYINITPGHMEHMSTFVSEMERDLSHGVNRSDNDFMIISPPYFRNSFGISSIPGGLPIVRLFKAFVIDSFVKTIENILSP